MSLIKNSKDNNYARSLSSNDKVMHYLQNSTCGSTNNSLTILNKSSPNNLFHRLRSCSENDSISSSSSSAIGSLSRSDNSNESSLSDPIGHSSTTSSNLLSEEELDFNIGFDQINDNDFDEEDNQCMLNKNNADAVTLLGESNVDARLNELEEFFSESPNSPNFNDEYEFNNDNTITINQAKQRQYTSFLHDSTHTLCSPDRFSAYTEDDEQESKQGTSFSIRSNSLSLLQLNEASSFLEKAPKKVVHFADMMGLDLESIRYMTPPDQTTSLIQECVRLQLGHMRYGKNNLNLPNIYHRTSSTSSLISPTKSYNLVSKNFTSPTNIIPLIYKKQVMLECLYTKDSTACGTIRVHNCAYNKRVFIRLSQDEWETSYDIEACHSMNYSHDNTDIFMFEIILPKSYNDIKGTKRILFAACLQAMDQEFWDNNHGWNYVLDVFEKR